MTFALPDYLDRIGLERAERTVEGLDALVKAQMSAITFENVEPLFGIVPDLSPAAVWRKLVVGRRGGYCMEQNSLLGTALEALGFSARPFLGRVRLGAPTGRQRSHYAWTVSLGGREYLADAGFGGPAAHGIVPLEEPGTEHEIAGRVFRVREDRATGERVVERLQPDGWFALYGFDEVPVTSHDVEAANFVAARWEKSSFPSHLMLSLHRSEGRAAMFDRMLTLEGADGTEKRELASADEFEATLDGIFGLNLDRATVDAVWARIGGPARP